MNIMSWSVNYFGKPEKVSEALTAQSANLSGQSKQEYDAALPHLVALVNLNIGQQVPLIKLAACGHGTANAEGIMIENNCSVQLEHVYGMLV